MMMKKFTCKLIAAAVCACLAVSGFTLEGRGEVLAQVISEGYEDADVRDADTPGESAGAEGIKDAGDLRDTENIQDAGDKDGAKGTGEVADMKEQGSTGTAERQIAETAKAKISLDDPEKILIEFKITKSKVNDDPFDGAFYYKDANMHPVMLVYPIERIADDAGIDEDKIYKNEQGELFEKGEALTKGTDYTVSYPSACQKPGKYELTVSAAASSGEYEGAKKIPYEVVEKEHKWSDWKTTVKQTVFNDGQKQRTCSVCGKTETVVLAKPKAKITLNMTTIPIQAKKTTTLFKVSGLAAGDSVKKYESSNKKIFTVDKKGKIKAKKKGTAKLTVTLASGKKATAKVKVQKGAVKTTKVTVNASSLVLLKGGNYTLNTTLAPLTTQQKVTYSSSNNKVATVSSKGVVTAKKKGTANITVKSGSKKKKIKITVQVPTFPKGDGNAFLESCKKIANTIMSDGNWIYYSGAGMKKSFAEARDYTPRQTSCANYVNFCMQDFGTLEAGMAFYSDGNGKLVYQGNAAKKAATKALVEKNYDIMKIGGKKAVVAGLVPGDICLYKGHTNVFAGMNSEGVPMWYDAGRNSTSDGKPQSGYFTNMYRASYYNSMPIYIVLRLKKE